jgi:hypothetical protein
MSTAGRRPARIHNTQLQPFSSGRVQCVAKPKFNGTKRPSNFSGINIIDCIEYT